MTQYKRILVTGAARSGTKYTAELLSQLSGIPGSHEEIFGLHKTPAGRGKVRGLDLSGSLPSWGSYRICVSWLAAPFIGRLPGQILVVHQVRHPFHAIRSIYRRKFLQRGNPYGEFVVSALDNLAEDWKGHVDLWDLWPEGLEAACEYWVKWNQMILNRGTHLWWRVEDLYAGFWILEPLLEHTVGDVRRPVSHLDRIEVPTNLNAGDRSDSDLSATLEDIPDKWRPQVYGLARRFGYEV